jgi:hypothetical protein
VSILDVLKQIKFPSFEEDFIQDPTEKAIEEAPVTYGGKVVHDPRRDQKNIAAKEDLRGWMEKQENERHNIPGDPQYIPSVSEEW